jgi:hypothetical protein
VYWKVTGHSKDCDAASIDKLAVPIFQFNTHAWSVRYRCADSSRRQPDCVFLVGFPSPPIAYGTCLACPDCSYSTRNRSLVPELNLTGTLPARRSAPWASADCSTRSLAQRAALPGDRAGIEIPENSYADCAKRMSNGPESAGQLGRIQDVGLCSKGGVGVTLSQRFRKSHRRSGGCVGNP